MSFHGTVNVSRKIPVPVHPTDDVALAYLRKAFQRAEGICTFWNCMTAPPEISVLLGGDYPTGS